VNGGEAVDLREQRKLNQGMGDSLARAFELVMAPLIFAFIGHLIDGWVGMRFTFALVLGLFGLAGTFAKMWFTYNYAMKAEEAKAPWRRSTP
jgi:F0F1-type ATP synthase assembly protein I